MSSWNQKRARVVDNFLVSTTTTQKDDHNNNRALIISTNSLSGAGNSSLTNFEQQQQQQQHATMLMSHQGIAGEQLLETVRLTIKDLVRDLLGISSLPTFFRNFEETFSSDSADVDDVLEATTGSSGCLRTRQQNQLVSTADSASTITAAPVVKKNKKERRDEEGGQETSEILEAAAGPNDNNKAQVEVKAKEVGESEREGDVYKIGAGSRKRKSSPSHQQQTQQQQQQQQHNGDHETAKLYAGLRAIALVPRLRRNVDEICIACVDRLFSLVGPEISMVASLRDKIDSMNKELAGVRKTLASREDLALTQRTELLRELTAAYEQEQAAEARFDALADKCKLLAQHQGKAGITELFRPLPPPKQKLNPTLRVPIEPIHPQTGTAVIGAKVKQLTDRLEAQWELLEEVDRVKAHAKEESRDASIKIREARERLAREKEITHFAKKSEEVLKEEVSRLQARLRQADLMLRAKEHDVELAILREREVAASAGRDSKIQQLLYKQQEQEARIKRMQTNERLKMEVADYESQMSQLTEQYTQQAADASSHIRKLETELEKTKRELRDAKMNAGEGKLDVHGRSGSKARDASGRAGAKDKTKNGAGDAGGDEGDSGVGGPRRGGQQRVGARVQTQYRLQTEQMEALIQQLKDQLRSERSHNDRVLIDKDKKIRDRDVEILSLRDSVSKAGAIQMALQGELDALAASADNKFGRSTTSATSLLQDATKNGKNNTANNNNKTNSSASVNTANDGAANRRGRSASVVSGDGGGAARRRRSFNPFYDPDDDDANNDGEKKSTEDAVVDDDNEDEFDAIQRIKKERNERERQGMTEGHAKALREHNDELIKHLQHERSTLAATAEELRVQRNDFEREAATLKVELQMKDDELERHHRLNRDQITDLNEQLRQTRERIAELEHEQSQNSDLLERSTAIRSSAEAEAQSEAEGATATVADANMINDKLTARTESSSTIIHRSSQHPTTTMKNTVSIPKRLPHDIAEIERLRKENEFLQAKVSNLDQELNAHARKSLTAAFNASKRRDFCVQVVPLDIMSNQAGRNTASSRNEIIHRGANQTSTSTIFPGTTSGSSTRSSSSASNTNINKERGTDQESKQRQQRPPRTSTTATNAFNKSAVVVVDQLPPPSPTSTSVAPHSHQKQQQQQQRPSSASSSNREKVVKFQDEPLDNSENTDNNKNDSSINNNNDTVNPQENRSSSISPQRRSNPNKTTTTTLSTSSASPTANPVEVNYVSPCQFQPPGDSTLSAEDNIGETSRIGPGSSGGGAGAGAGAGGASGTGTGRLHRPGSRNMMTRSSQLRLELNQQVFPRRNDQQQHDDDEREEDEQQRQQLQFASKDFEDISAANDKYHPRVNNLATALLVIDEQRQQQQQHEDVSKSSRSRANSVPAWIDMTELVLKAQKYLAAPQEKESSSAGSNPSKFYRNHFQQQPSQQQAQVVHSFSLHQNRCHDLRLGFDEASTQTDDVIIVEHSPEVSLLDMMKPLSISNVERQRQRNEGFGLDRQGYAVITPYNNSNNNNNNNNSKTNTNYGVANDEQEYVALLVKLSDLSGFSTSSSQRKSEQTSSSSTSCIVHHHLQQYSTPAGETILHYPSTQGAVVTKIQIPPLKFSLSAADESDTDQDHHHHQQQQTQQQERRRPTSARANQQSQPPRPPTSQSNNSTTIIHRPLSAFSNTSTEVARKSTNAGEDDDNHVLDNDYEDDDDDDDDDKVICDYENDYCDEHNVDMNEKHQNYARVGKSILVPHSFGTAQMTGTAVARQLQNLLTKALTQWKRDNISRAAAKAATTNSLHHHQPRRPTSAQNSHQSHHQALGQQRNGANVTSSASARRMSGAAIAVSRRSSPGIHNTSNNNNHNHNKNSEINFTVRPSSSSSSSWTATRPREALYIPRNPVNESIESGANRQPHYRHPVPNDQQLRFAQNVPAPMEQIPDDPDRRYPMSDRQRIPMKSWFDTMTE